MSYGVAQVPHPESLVRRGRVRPIANTLAELKTELLRVEVGRSVEVLGRNAANDGYGGYFFRSNTDYSALAAVDVQEGVYIDLGDGTYGVRSYGQVVDSAPELRAAWFGFITSNTAAVNDTAIHGGIAVGRYAGLTLRLGAGQYAVTGIEVVEDGAAFGPIKIIGAGQTDVRFSSATGTQLVQDDAAVKPVIKLHGDWATSNRIARNIHLSDFSVRGGTANNTQLIDLFNVSGFPSVIERINGYTPNSECYGLLARSCWSVSFRDLRFDGPAEGLGTVTGRGFVVYGDNGTGVTNQINIENVVVRDFGVNMQLGKYDEAIGGVTAGVKVIGGESSGADLQGLILGSCSSSSIDTFHIENSQRNGLLIDTNANGAYSVKLTGLDTYNNGLALASTQDSYEVRIRRAKELTIDHYSLDNATGGFFFNVNSELDNVYIDKGVASPKGGALAIFEASTAPTNQNIYVGKYRAGAGFANIFVNAAAFGRILNVDNVVTKTDNSATPEISFQDSMIHLIYTASTDVTDIVPAANEQFFNGQTVKIISGNTNATIKDQSTGGNFHLELGLDKTLTVEDVLTLMYRNGEWREVAYANN